MITDFSMISDLFKELDRISSKNIRIFLIGGGALMKYRMKPYTKDIDIVVDSMSEFEELSSVLINAGFETQIPGKEYERLAVSQIFIRGDFRIDLFFRYVCGKFYLSEGMKEHSTFEMKLEKLTLNICSLGDILLFKSMTERDGDLEDSWNIVKSDRITDWDAILDEARLQSSGENSVWITWITDRLELLAERGAKIPILDEMSALSDEYINEWERGLLERNKDM